MTSISAILSTPSCNGLETIGLMKGLSSALTVIRDALQQKRIGNNDIVNALSLIDEEAYTTLLADLLEKKSRSINDEDVEVRRSKLLRFAASRGFETELVFRILKEIES